MPLLPQSQLTQESQKLYEEVKRKQDLVKQLEEEIGTASQQLEEVSLRTAFERSRTDAYPSFRFSDGASSGNTSNGSDAPVDGTGAYDRAGQVVARHISEIAVYIPSLLECVVMHCLYHDFLRSETSCRCTVAVTASMSGHD